MSDWKVGDKFVIVIPEESQWASLFPFEGIVNEVLGLESGDLKFDCPDPRFKALTWHCPFDHARKLTPLEEVLE